MAERDWGFKTRSIHAGARPDPHTGARAVPIYQTSAFVFNDTADAGSLFALQKYGNIYSRIANPTVATFEERIASLERGLGAIATASGLSAEFLTFAALAGVDDRICAAGSLYGGKPAPLQRAPPPLRVPNHLLPRPGPPGHPPGPPDRAQI